MMDESTMKELPHKPELEAAFLADLFLEPTLIDTYRDRVKDTDLYAEKHRKVYRAMRNVWSRDGALDTLAVIDELDRRGAIDTIGGPNEVNRIAGKTTSVVNHEQHADRVIDLSKRRELIKNFEKRARSLRKDGTDIKNVAKVATSNIRQAVEALDPDGRPDDPAQLAVSSTDVSEWLAGESLPKREALLTIGDRNDPAPFLVRGKTAMLVAPGGAGKTGLLAQLAVAVATGTEWLQYNVERPGKVLLALGEEDDDEMQRRVYYAFNGRHGDADNIDELADRMTRNLVPMPLYATNPRFIESDPMGRRSEPTPSLFYRRLLDYLEDAGPWSLIIIDPASRFMGAEVEKDNAAATRFVELLEKMTQVDEDDAPAVLTAHHTNKGAYSAEKTDQGAARGSSALVDGVRWCANIERYDKDEPDDLPDGLRKWRRLRVTKTNYTKAPEPLAIRFEKGRGWLEVSESDKRRRERAINGKGATETDEVPTGMV